MQSEALPELYKKTETGAIQRWVISVDGIDIITQFGQVGGKTQSTMDTIREGKNQGRKGETGPEEQALKEAKARWIKKKKAGYVESLKDAECVSGDTVIRFSRGGKSFKATIADAYTALNREFKEKNKNWDPAIQTFVRSLKGDRIGLNLISGIVKMGRKKLILLELENGYNIKATSDHLILTDRGYIQLGKLKKSDLVVCDEERRAKTNLDKTTKTRRDTVRCLKYHPYGYKDRDYVRADKHRLVYEASINKIPFDSFIEILKSDKDASSGLMYINPTTHHIHHIDEDTGNDSVENLVCLNADDHRKMHRASQYRNFNQGIPNYSKVMGVEKLGVGEVYDIQCHAPHHNFSANGIIVHNCGKTDAIISGGVLPMLAKVYEDYSSKIIYPASIQPKLDGHRCIAIVSSGKATLWSRTRKKISSVPHIEKAVEDIAWKNGIKELVLDGELYSHEFKDDFEQITSIARKKEPSADSLKLQYHIYDIVSNGGFKDRIERISEIFRKSPGGELRLVETWEVDDEFETMNFYDRFRKMGYEGAMLRQHTGTSYEGKRTDKLLKIKSFTDGEFKIVLVEEGRGKLQGHAGNFLCETSSGKIFGAKLAGDTARLKTIFENKKEYVGQLITVKYQGLTKEGIPRFPVGIRIREDL